MYLTLFDMWNAEKEKGKLPDNWRTYRDFLCWANENKYKVEYGFKGGFSIANCLTAIPGNNFEPAIKAGAPEASKETKKPAPRRAKTAKIEG